MRGLSTGDLWGRARVEELAADARHRHAQWLERLLAIALVADCRVAISSRQRYPLAHDYDVPIHDYELVWDFVMLMPGEKPPEGRAWTIYERRADIGWQGRVSR